MPIRGRLYPSSLRRLFICDFHRPISMSCFLSFPHVWRSNAEINIKVNYDQAEDVHFANRRTYLTANLRIQIFDNGGVLVARIVDFDSHFMEGIGIRQSSIGALTTFQPAYESGMSCGTITVEINSLIYASNAMVGLHCCRFEVADDTIVSTPIRIARFLSPALRYDVRPTDLKRRLVGCSVAFPNPGKKRDNEENHYDKRTKKLGYAMITTQYPGFPIAKLILKLGDTRLKTFNMMLANGRIKAIAPIVFTPKSSRVLSCYVENHKKFVTKPRRVIYIEEPFAPHSVTIDQTIYVYYQDYLPSNISCSCEGYPKPRAYWRSRTKFSIRVVKKDVLHLNKDDPATKYEYECICLNKAGWLIHVHKFEIVKKEFEVKLQMASQLVAVVVTTSLILCVMIHRLLFTK